MLIALPSGGISQIEWTPPDPMVFVARNRWNASRTVGDLGGVRSGWRANVELITSKAARHQAWAAFFARARGPVNSFKLPASVGAQAGPATATWAMSGTGAVYNYCLYSAQFDNAAWSKINSATVVANQYVAPDGTMTADQLNTTGSTTVAVQMDTATAAAVSTSYVASVYLYAPTAGYLITMVLETTTGVGGAVVTQKALSAGWARYFVTFTTTGAATGNLRMLLARATTGTSGLFGVWGAQIELGVTPSAYVATTGAAALSRAAFRVTGLTVSATNMTEGQLVTVDDRLYTITADVVADTSGKATVSVEPSLAVATTAASIAYVQNPYCVMQLAGGPYGFTASPGAIYKSAAFECEEVIA